MSSTIYIKRLIDEMSNILEGTSTGRLDFKNYDVLYVKNRNRLINLAPMLGNPPDFLIESKDLLDLWHKHIKFLATYDERRIFLKANFTDYYQNKINLLKTYSFEETLALRDILVGKQIGDGGFGVVYKGEHMVFDEYRAIKKLEPLFANEESEIIALRRFSREAKILANLNHPNIVKVYDSGIAADYPYIVMEYIAGSNLHKYLDENGVFNCEKAIHILKQVLSALACAHSQGIVHRDIKPQNIMWDDTKATLLDFGTGQWLEHELTTRDTKSAIGTSGYIAPELFENPKLLNPNLDCYSVGVFIHYILTGHLPYPGNTSFYFEKSTNSIDKKLIEIFHRAIAPPDHRYKNCSEMLITLNGTNL